MQPIDGFDLKILAALQEDGRLTNNELADRVALSASQISRRRMWLEQEGYIRAYHAEIDREKMGLDMMVVITVTLSRHKSDTARRFAALVRSMPDVLEAYALTGEMDYHLKVVTAGLKGLSAFVNDVLLAHESVQHVKTAIVLETLKESGGLPILR